jgi:hypothetical protein
MTSQAERFAALLGTPPTNKSPVKEHFCQTAPVGMQFVPINAVAKFPYKYMSHNQGETVSKQFFARGRFYERDWDL